jgi:hydroxymethylpyrimidine/phosphomethylpyrimidine kinase
MTTPVALTIAGSDSSGGAGIQADLKTFAALGVYGASAITALTAQNTKGVTGIHAVPAAFVTAQIDAVFSDLDVGAVKIGMVAQAESIDAIASALARWKPRHIVLDPVMVATSGDRLLAAEAVEALRTKLMRLASVITPNLPEAAALLDEPIARSEGRTRRGQRQHRLSRQRRQNDRACRIARRHAQHPWHRLLAVLGGCGGPRQGRGSRDGRAQCQGLDQCSD